MFGFTEITEALSGKIADSPLGKAALERQFAGNWLLAKDWLSHDAPLGMDAKMDAPETASFLPSEHGEWDGEPGDSKWTPDKDEIPKSQNPDGRTWGEILKEYNIDGIPFKDGEPDFSEISKGTVHIDNFTDNRYNNFTQADIKLAQEKGWTPSEAKEYRKDDGLTWHELKDMGTMQLVPQDIHNNIAHSGGIAEIKRKEAA